MLTEPLVLQPGIGNTGAPSMPAGFGVFLVIGILLAVGSIAWKVSAARRIASKSGLDPDQATEMALMTDDGLEATYLASSLRQPPADEASAPSPPPNRSVTERLEELEALRRDRLVAEREYAQRRKAILDDL